MAKGKIMKIRIESPTNSDGLVSSQGTRVFAVDEGNGLAEIKGITDLTVSYPLNGVVSATIGCMVSPHSIEANPLLAWSSLKEAAEYYGYELVRAKKFRGGE